MIRLMAFVMAAVLGAQNSPVTVQKLSRPEKALRFEVAVPASIDAVWVAFSTQAGLQTWLWRDAQVDLRPGGDWLVLFPGRGGSAPSAGGGTIVSFVPRQRLELRALAPERFPRCGRNRRAVFEFQSLTPQSTRVTLTQTGWKTGQEWDDAYDTSPKATPSY
jgi:uncharacterized protein YndB with AHSA1/START domain